jgi:hypothetical protein
MTRFKTMEEPVFSTEPMYDIVHHGRLAPERLLSDPDDVARVQGAIKVVLDYLRDAERDGVLEIG